MPMQTDKDNGRTCVCGAPADPREVQGVRFIHAMPGAGAEITASELFADLLHLARTLVEWNIPQII
jgi:hypothetical protein